MAHESLGSHLRTHRKKSGLTQCELAQLLGYDNESPVSRHERAVAIPPLRVALAYEAIFQVPISELFPAIHQAVGESVEVQLAEFESLLGQKSARDWDADATARKFQFIWKRKNGIEL